MTGSTLKGCLAVDVARRRLVSTGFMALDVVLSNAPHVAAGGTATNVAVAVATMGWHSEAVGTIGDDPAGRFVRNDLLAAGAGVSGLRLDTRWDTPVVLQERVRNDHVWRFVCPECGSRFAKHRPGAVSDAEQLLARIPPPDVFFFDRLSRYSLALASGWAESGSLVVFEPSGLGRPQLFRRALEVAHLVKYSDQRASGFETELAQYGGAIVRTSGPQGARYRAAGSTVWIHSDASQARVVMDTAGAGDWTTAGLLARLFDISDEPKQALSSIECLGGALRHGQDWGAAACGWTGARPPSVPKSDVANPAAMLYCSA